MNSHAYVVAAILASGGRLVASFELDKEGRTVGAPLTHNRRRRCGACGEHGHDLKRCNGEGQAPRPSYDERVRGKIRSQRSQMDEAHAEIARRIQARGKR